MSLSSSYKSLISLYIWFSLSLTIVNLEFSPSSKYFFVISSFNVGYLKEFKQFCKVCSYLSLYSLQFSASLSWETEVKESNYLNVVLNYLKSKRATIYVKMQSQDVQIQRTVIEMKYNLFY